MCGGCGEDFGVGEDLRVCEPCPVRGLQERAEALETRRPPPVQEASSVVPSQPPDIHHSPLGAHPPALKPHLVTLRVLRDASHELSYVAMSGEKIGGQ